MKTKIILIVGIIIIVISTFIFQNFKGTDKNEIKSDEQVITSNKPIQQDNINITGSTIGNTDLEKNQGIFKQAIENKDIGLCKTINDEFYKNDCINNLVSMLSKDSKSDDICDELKDDLFKSSCKNDINSRLGNCSKLESLDKEQCEKDAIFKKAETTLNISHCNKFGKDNLMEKEQCIQDITVKKAINDGNIDLCKKLDPVFQNMCISKVIVEIAVNKNDIKYCDNEKEISSFCKISVSKRFLDTTMDIKYCDYLSDKNGCKLKITSKKALINQDIKVCEQLESKNKQDCVNFYKDIMKQLEIR